MSRLLLITPELITRRRVSGDCGESFLFPAGEEQREEEREEERSGVVGSSPSAYSSFQLTDSDFSTT